MSATSKSITASHIAVGSELTSGQTLNTNSQFMAGYLQKRGVLNNYHLVVPDNKSLIIRALDLCTPESDWIFIYGGLGPTTDDFTRIVVSEWANLSLEFHEPTWQYIKDSLTSRNYPVREFQSQQAYFPKDALIMPNSKGTAHGFCFSLNQKMFFLLPGPPKEILSICENFLFEYIDRHTKNLNQWLTFTWNTLGQGESEIANQVEQKLIHFPVEVGYRVNQPYVEVKISFFKEDLIKNTPLLETIDSLLEPILAYKQEAPFKDFFLRKLSSIKELEIQDNFTFGLIYEDLKKWGIKLNEMNFIISSQLREIQLRNYFIIEKMDPETVAIKIAIENKILSFELKTTTIISWSTERKVLYIKEKIYLYLIKHL